MKRNSTTCLTIIITVLMLLAIFHTLPVRALPSGLVNFWPADGNANDIIGGNNGVLINGAGFGPGITNLAFSFNGNGQFMQASNPVPFGSNDFSIDLWANFNSIPGGCNNVNGCQGGGTFVADDNGPGCTDKWWFALGGGVLAVHLNTPTCAGLGFFAQSPFTPNLNQWYNLAVTRTSGTIAIYVNCAQVSSEFTSTAINPTVPLTIGWGELSSFFNGLIDDVQIYNRALAASEIQSICHPSQVKVSKFFTDTSLNPLPLDKNGNPKVDVVIAGGVVRSTNPGEIMAWVNVTNTSGSLQSLKLNETLPVDWVVSPPWMPALGAIHVFYGNTTSLATNPEITQPSTITVSGPSPPQTVHLAIPSFNATAIGHPLLTGQSILLEVKLDYFLDGTTQSASTYPRNYTDTATAKGWTMPSFTGTAVGPSTATGLFVAYAKVVGDVDSDGSVDITDLVLVWQHQFSHNLQYDVNGDGAVDLNDLVLTWQFQFT